MVSAKVLCHPPNDHETPNWTYKRRNFKRTVCKAWKRSPRKKSLSGHYLVHFYANEKSKFVQSDWSELHVVIGHYGTTLVSKEANVDVAVQFSARWWKGNTKNPFIRVSQAGGTGG